jgi:hypothetical protein
MRGLLALVLGLGLAAASATASAEIEKVAVPTDKGLTLHWWPKLPDVTGWHFDRDASYHYGFAAWAPDNSTFADAETVIYARAIYKPRDPGTKSLDMLIEQDKQRFLAGSPGTPIEPAASLRTADGRSFRSLSFPQSRSGTWDRAAYGEEGDYYLMFILSSRSQSGYQKAMAAFETFIARYK